MPWTRTLVAGSPGPSSLRRRSVSACAATGAWWRLPSQSSTRAWVRRDDFNSAREILVDEGESEGLRRVFRCRRCPRGFGVGSSEPLLCRSGWRTCHGSLKSWVGKARDLRSGKFHREEWTGSILTPRSSSWSMWASVGRSACSGTKILQGMVVTSGDALMAVD